MGSRKRKGASRLRLLVSLVAFAPSRASKMSEDAQHASTASPRGEIHDCWALHEQQSSAAGTYGTAAAAAAARPCCDRTSPDAGKTQDEVRRRGAAFLQLAVQHLGEVGPGRRELLVGEVERVRLLLHVSPLHYRLSAT